MPRTWFRAPAALVLGLVISGCTAAAVPNASPSEPGGQAATTAPSPVVTSPSATSPAPSATHLPARTDPPSPTPFAILDGEPWLLLNAFVANDRKAAYLVRPDGTSLRRILTGLAADVRDSSWSPDGQHIVFSVRDSSTPDGSIWTADADGSNPKLLYDGRADGCGAVWDGVWSPDGTRISLICYRGYAGTPELPNAALLSVLDIKRHHLTNVATTHWPDFLDGPASWSPDGRTIAFDILHWDPTNAFIDGSRVMTVPANGSARATQLDEISSFAAYPDWSPDGGRLVYNTRDLGEGPHDGPSNLFTMKADGSDVRQLTTASTSSDMRIGHPRWDPDGSRIWVTILRGGDVNPAWVDPTSGAVTELGVNGSRPEPRPTP